MSRFGGVFWFILVIASGMTNFIVKQNVQALDDQLNAVRKKTVTEQKAIHELTADWTFLNQPELLADLNNRYVHLTAVSPKQITTNLDGIPLRPAPPAPEAAPQIAQALDAPTMSSAPPPPPATAPASPPRPPLVPVSVSAPAHAPAASAPIITAAVTPPPPRPVKAASLDGLFSHVTGDR